MKQAVRLRNNLKQIRTRQGMSQQELAHLAGVTRQTISGMESDLFSPSAAVALKIARALGCRVEDLLWLEDDLPELEAAPAEGSPTEGPFRAMLAQVGGRWVAHPLVGEQAFRSELIPADGEAVPDPATGRLRVRPLDDLESLSQSIVLAGCSPAISLWAKAAERWNPGMRVHWVFANSSQALRALARGEVHAGGVHLYDPATQQHNVPFVRAALPGQAVVLINLGIWEEGLLLAPGNPRGIRRCSDLAQPGVRLINRETGAGSRLLLERFLQQERVPPEAVTGFDRVVQGHAEVALAVAAGQADVGVSTAAVARTYGLDFLPLQQVRYDMAVPTVYLDLPPMRQLFTTLNHRRVRSQLEALGGYDLSLTGEVVAEIKPE